MSGDEAETVGAAYRTYRKLQHKLRLDGMEKARVEPELVAAGARGGVGAVEAGVWVAIAVGLRLA